MPWGYAAVAVGTIAAGALSSNASKNAANKGAQGQLAAQEAYKQYNQPYYDAGTSALARLDRLASGDFSGFTASPAYQFNLGQQQEGLLRAAASRGALNSGGTDVDLQRQAAGLASNEYGNYLSSLQYLAGIGQSSAQGLGGSASNAASNIGQIQAGNAANQGAIYGNTLGQLSNLFGQYQANNASTYQQPVYQGQGSAYGFGNNLSNFSTGGYNFGPTG